MSLPTIGTWHALPPTVTTSHLQFSRQDAVAWFLHTFNSNSQSCILFWSLIKILWSPLVFLLLDHQITLHTPMSQSFLCLYGVTMITVCGKDEVFLWYHLVKDLWAWRLIRAWKSALSSWGISLHLHPPKGDGWSMAALLILLKKLFGVPRLWGTRVREWIISMSMFTGWAICCDFTSNMKARSHCYLHKKKNLHKNIGY